MGRLGRRLENLERRREGSSGDVSREVLRRMTDEELEAYAAVLDADEETTDEQAPVLRRVEELFREVGRGAVG